MLCCIMYNFDRNWRIYLNMSSSISIKVFLLLMFYNCEHIFRSLFCLCIE